MNRRCVVVLGMHRTGTSAMTGLLTLAGAYPGSHLLPPNISNPKGFFESVRVVELNNKLLSLLGSRWDDMNPLPTGWATSAEVRECRQEIAAFVADEFCSSVTVLKDPRLCRTLPLWLDVMKEVGITPSFILCMRNPAEVARSEKTMKGLPYVKSLMLYMDYSLSAEFNTRGFRRVVVDYQQLISNWRAVIDHISNAIDFSFPVSSQIFLDSVADFITENLNRSAIHGSDEFHQCGQLAVQTTDLFASMLELHQENLNQMRSRFETQRHFLTPWFHIIDKMAEVSIRHPLLDFSGIFMPKLKASVKWEDPATGEFLKGVQSECVYHGAGDHKLVFQLCGRIGRRLRLVCCHRPATLTIRSVRLLHGGASAWELDNGVQWFANHAVMAVDITDPAKDQHYRCLVLDGKHHLELDIEGAAIDAGGHIELEVELKIEDVGSSLPLLFAKYRMLERLCAELREGAIASSLKSGMGTGGLQEEAHRMLEELMRAETQLELLKELVHLQREPVAW